MIHALCRQNCSHLQNARDKNPFSLISPKTPCSTPLRSSHPDLRLPLLQFRYRPVSLSGLKHRHQFENLSFTPLPVWQKCDNESNDALTSAQHLESWAKSLSSSPAVNKSSDSSFENPFHQTHFRKGAASSQSIRNLKSVSIVAPSSKTLPFSDERILHKRQCSGTLHDQDDVLNSK